MLDAGLSRVEIFSFSDTFADDRWRVHVQTGGPTVIVIFVSIVDDDARAAEILAPVLEALGTTVG